MKTKKVPGYSVTLRPDLKMLRKQKAILVTLAHEPSKDADLLNGLVHLLDSIQDQIADQIGERKVFGKLK